MASTRVIGVDIGTTAIRGAELDIKNLRSGGKPTLVRIAEIALAPGHVRDGEVVNIEAVGDSIRQLWQQAKFSAKSAVIGIGNQRVFTRTLEMPWLPLKDLKSALPFQVHQTLPMSVEDVLMDFVPTDESDGNSGKMVKGLFVAAQKDTVNAGVLTLSHAGISPAGVDLNALAAARSTIYGNALNQTVALVDVGARVTNIVVLDHGKPRLVRVLLSGGQEITDSIAKVRGISIPEAEQLKREIGVGFRTPPGYEDVGETIERGVQNIIEGMRNTMVYYAQNRPDRPIEAILLSGGTVHLKGFGQYTASVSRMAVGLADPFANLVNNKDSGLSTLVADPSTYSVAIGLAYGDFS